MASTDLTVSECSDDIDISPLELTDLKRRLEESGSSDDETHLLLEAAGHRYFSAVYGIGLKKKREHIGSKKFIARVAWKNAIQKARSLGDPWAKFHLDTHKMEKAKRHRYNALKQCWVVDEVAVKMEVEPFNHGAMRECFRLKKLSNFAKSEDWSRAHNYVAKRYMNEDVSPETYLEDVRLQMDAKLWGEEYNRHNPPKKVDIFQMCVLEFHERPLSPLYHLEHFIEGKYVKYNSNSGFVRSEMVRMTPQAVSHFTFERSGHELMVVDIQGVGDLYTDPQIHTASGKDYGDGNLGTRGMALFLHSHVCNSICKSLGLTQFDLAPTEISANEASNVQVSSKTVIRGTEEPLCLPSEEERVYIHESLRLRSLSSGYLSGDDLAVRAHLTSIGSVDSVDSDDIPISENEDSSYDSCRRQNVGGSPLLPFLPRGVRFRLESSSSEICDSVMRETEALQFKKLVEGKSRASNVVGEMERRKSLHGLMEDGQHISVVSSSSVLGQVHLDLAKYHELSRFVEESETYDQDAALFHVEQAAKCGLLEAIVTMTRLHLGLAHDILPNIELTDDEQDPEKGFDYLLTAAHCGDRGAMVQVAMAYDKAVCLPDSRRVNWTEAVEWYNKAVNTITQDEEGNFDGTMDSPQYQLVARQAAMYSEGGNGLEMNPNKAGELYNWAAELATEAMKGKLASKYYMLAEEEYAKCDDEE